MSVNKLRHFICAAIVKYYLLVAEEVKPFFLNKS